MRLAAGLLVLIVGIIGAFAVALAGLGLVLADSGVGSTSALAPYQAAGYFAIGMGGFIAAMTLGMAALVLKWK